MSNPSPAIPISVTRTRITVLGFTLTVNLFAIDTFLSSHPGEDAMGMWVLFLTALPLFLGLIFSCFAMFIFLISQRHDHQGNSKVWLFGFGEVFMYIAFTQTLSGVLFNMMGRFKSSLVGAFEWKSLAEQTGINFDNYASHLYWWLFVIAGIVWFFLTYVAPFFSVRRLPLPWGRKWRVLASYGFLLLCVFWISGLAYNMKILTEGYKTSPAILLLGQFFQPILWGR